MVGSASRETSDFGNVQRLPWSLWEICLELRLERAWFLYTEDNIINTAFTSLDEFYLPSIEFMNGFTSIPDQLIVPWRLRFLKLGSCSRPASRSE